VLTVMNKEPSTADVFVEANPMAAVWKGSALRLRGPSLESETNIMLGGARVSTKGVWSPSQLEAIAMTAGKSAIHVPPASAAIVTLPR
jgi:hypothetical protein